jgi:hypothetical protein
MFVKREPIFGKLLLRRFTTKGQIIGFRDATHDLTDKKRKLLIN